MKFVSRSAWGARPPRKRTSLSSPRGTTIHWVGPKVGAFPHDRCNATVRGIQNFHMDTRGWADIAYTALVCPHGYVYEGRGVGVRTAANGTDAGNSTHYAVCALVGEGDPITPDLLRGLSDAILWLRSKGAGNDVNSHRDHKDTTCPGNALARWASNYRPPTTEEDDMPLNDADKAWIDGKLQAHRDWALANLRQTALNELRALAIGSAGREAALIEAVRQLSTNTTIDLDAISAAAESGIQRALDDARIVVQKGAPQ